MDEVTLNLTREECEAIVKVLGQLPTSSNAYPLLVKIIQQINGQSEPVVEDEAA